MKGYKGFNEDLQCRGKQYEVGKEFKEDVIPLECVSGMHFCENPLDVLDYYPILDSDNNENKFCEVESTGEVDKGDRKISTDSLKISAEIGMKGLIKAGVEWILKSTESEKTSGNNSQLASSGYNCVIMSAGIAGIAKAKKGSWITLAEWQWDNEKENYIPISVVTKQVDGEEIKEDTFYRLVDGTFREEKLND